MKQSEKPGVSLLRFLAIGSTAETRALLAKHGESPIGDYKTLEVSLVKLWQKTPDKVALEKEFVDIHPHKDLIIKYADPAPNDAIEAIEPLQVQTDTKLDDAQEKGNQEEKKSNCGGCSSRADGMSSTDKDNVGQITDLKKEIILNYRYMIGAGAVLAAVGILCHYKVFSRA